MMNFAELASLSPDPAAPFTDQLRLAAAAYLARFKGSSREHTESDLRCYLTWCAERGLDPLAAQRPHLELYIRSMQEIRRFKPSTVSRRFSVAAGFYRTCVLDGVLEHSPAEHVRRPAVPAESPTLGFTHLQFEALLTATRQSANPYDFALVAMLGLLGLRIFEATSAAGRCTGNQGAPAHAQTHFRYLYWVRPEARRNPGLAASCLMSIRYSARYVLQGRCQGLSLFDAAFDLTWLTCLSSQNGHLPGILRSPVQITLVTTMLDAGVDLRDVQIAALHADPRTTMRYDRARQNLDRHPNYILAAFMASGT